ncbi:TlpA family protein disulfide reductase [Spirosoma sp. KCTC 42546]|uniref:TlpA family protein disulfide reductase n=1 Tax=Spirosoma sp. KCTC 42546 TaxID=2520506 RepID=UPI00115A0726|nr:TlpA disulfide reductase family protein [Spirosoma sp. KCTC 42546]QDK81722.1 TlpA family protein disulfide reductase [Spirosoma sp. KCTC 42546]
MNPIRTSLTLSLFLITTDFQGFAQTPKPSAAFFFNQFQQSISHKNLDSAFYNAEQLALENKAILNSLLHDSFAQSFITPVNPRVDTVFVKQLLEKLYTGNVPLQQAVYPLYKWVEVRTKISDTAKIHQLINSFLIAQARSEEEIGNRIDRYSLLICRTLKLRPVYSALADTLFERTRQRLEHAVNGVYYQATEDRRQRTIRAYFRYLMAYTNLTKANEALQQNKLTRAESYLKEASLAGPDDTDRQMKSAYFYEAVFLLNGQEDFHARYANFLVAKGDTASAVDVLTELTLADPGNIDLLKTYYQKSAYSKTPFQTYWTQQLNAKLKPTESFRLTDLDGKIIDYEQYRGKWVLIDFWGTWCKPCVEELPRFQKFYSDLLKTEQKNIVVFTAASRDTEPKVREFMKKQAYTFPVVMANDAFIKQFRVGEFPTKVLITPQGNRMKIPFGSNWVERIKIYSEN